MSFPSRKLSVDFLDKNYGFVPKNLGRKIYLHRQKVPHLLELNDQKRQLRHDISLRSALPSIECFSTCTTNSIQLQELRFAMSVAASSLRLAARRCQSGLTSKQSPLLRSFTTSSPRFEESTPKGPKEPAPAASLNPEDAQWARFENTIESIRHGELASATARIVNKNMTESQRRRRPASVPQKKQKLGLLNMNEKDSVEDPEFEEDDVTALAHGDLEQHREFRKYARLMAWEMPLLTSTFILCLAVKGDMMC